MSAHFSGLEHGLQYNVAELNWFKGHNSPFVVKLGGRVSVSIYE